MRTAFIIENNEPVNAIVLPEGPKGDAMLSDACVEVTGLDPQPLLGLGWTYVDGEFIAPPPEPLTWGDIRAKRDRLLAACDWTQVADAPLTATEKQAWADYRQALRDIPQTFDSPDDVVWPETP